MSPFPIRALLLAVTGALLGSVLWVLIDIAGNWESSFPALLVGVFAGAATRIEPRRGPTAQVAALIVTLIGMTVVQYLVVRYAIVTDRVDQDLSRSADLFLSPAAMWKVTFGWLWVYPLNIIPWVVSAAAAFWLPAGADDSIAPSSTFLSADA